MHTYIFQENHDERINELKEQLDNVISVKVQSEEKVTVTLKIIIKDLYLSLMVEW